MSKKRKKTGGNPANRPQRFLPVEQRAARERMTAEMVRSAEGALERAGEALVEAGATWEQVEDHRRAMRIKIASEALEIGAAGIFEWLMEPIANEMEILLALKEEGVDMMPHLRLGEEDDE